VLNSQITVGVKHQPINQRMHESINQSILDDFGMSMAASKWGCK
jgi:hypothetical protein